MNWGNRIQKWPIVQFVLQNSFFMYVFVTLAIWGHSGVMKSGLNEFLSFKNLSIPRGNDLAISKKSMQLPTIKALVKKEPIGYFGALPAPMVFNDLKYSANPSTISFAGWNSWIISKDRDFFANAETSPTYLGLQLLDVAGVVPQFVPMDSPLAQLEIFSRFSPVINPVDGLPVENLGILLLKRTPAPAGVLHRNLIQTSRFAIEEWVRVPEVFDFPLQVAIQMPKTFAARIIGTLYKPPLYRFHYRLDDGTTNSGKFTPVKASKGFLIAPLLLENDDYLCAASEVEWRHFTNFQKSLLRKIISYKVSCEYLSFAKSDQFVAEFSKIHGLGFGKSQITPIQLSLDVLCGEWEIDGENPKKNPSIHRSHRGEILLVNENGAQSRIKWGGFSLEAIDFKGFHGTLSANRKYIYWSNGTTWKRRS